MLRNQTALKLLALIVSFFSASVVAHTQSTQTTTTRSSQSTAQLPTVHETVEVTATRIPEDPEEVPATIEVFSGEELRERGARDLRSALSSAIGVEIAPGGDSGPASSVPDFWGLKEFDAFLLVVDGVPWGGAYNPALTSLNLSDVERIEVMRGPAPITYGATSFVGVIHVVHHGVDSTDRNVELHGGSFESGGGSLSTPVPLGGQWKSRLTLDAERLGFSDPREAYRRGHGLWRVERKYSGVNRVWFNFDMNWLDQDPNSPRLREGTTLSPDVPVDANHNPRGAFLNDHRGTIMGGFDRAVGSGVWTTTASVSHSIQDSFRGFLTEPDALPDNARGVAEKVRLTDIYVDSHFTFKARSAVTVILGADYLHGRARANGADFEYLVPVNGAFAVDVPRPDELDVRIEDNRNFFGPYAMVEWKPFERLRIDAGLRANLTQESRRDVDPDPAGPRDDKSDVTNSHLGANIGAIFTAWQNKQDSVGLYVNYRETFKPAAIDFGIGEEEEGGEEGGDQILKPETAHSVEGGVKGRLFNHRLELEASGFLMDFTNLVTATEIGGLPALVNSGTERFNGFETGMELFLPRNVIARANYSYHDARFTDLVQDFDGVPTQLAGKRLEMSAHNLTAASLYYLPAKGFLAGVQMNYTGDRFLNKRNTALAEGFATVDAGIGYRAQNWELRVDGRNLGDRRDPVSESELGESQYYLMPSRRVDATLRFHF